MGVTLGFKCLVIGLAAVGMIGLATWVLVQA